MTLPGIRERRRKMAILRAVRSHSLHIFLLLPVVADLLSLLGAASGLILLYAIIFIGQPLITSHYGFSIPATPLGVRDILIILLAIFF